MSWFITSVPLLIIGVVVAVMLTGVLVLYHTVLLADSLVVQVILAVVEAMDVAVTLESVGGVTSGAANVTNESCPDRAAFPDASADPTTK